MCLISGGFATSLAVSDILRFVVGIYVGPAIISLTTGDMRFRRRKMSRLRAIGRNPPNRAWKPVGFQIGRAISGVAAWRSKRAFRRRPPAAESPRIAHPGRSSLLRPHFRHAHRVKTLAKCAARWNALALYYTGSIGEAGLKTNSRPTPIPPSVRAAARAGRADDDQQFSTWGAVDANLISGWQIGPL